MQEKNQKMIDEGNIEKFKQIKEHVDELIFSNDDNKRVNLEKLFNRIESLRNRKNIKSLRIFYSSSFQELDIVKLFPNLEILVLFGQHLKNLNGIETCLKLRTVNIDTDCNKRRKIDGLEKTKIVSLGIRVSGEKDLEVIEKCNTLEWLRLDGSFDFKPQGFAKANLHTLSLVNRRIAQLANLELISKLKDLVLAYCSKLTSFGNNCSNIENLRIESCNNFDLNSLEQTPDLKTLNLLLMKNIKGFEFLDKLATIEYLSCGGGKVQTDDFTPIINSNSLTHVSLPTKDKLIQEISNANHKIVVSNGDVCYRGGHPVDFSEFELRIVN